MRFNRILLFVLAFAAAAALAGAFASTAGALAFADLPCPINPPGIIKICPQGETGKAYSLHVDGRADTWYRPIGDQQPCSAATYKDKLVQKWS